MCQHPQHSFFLHGDYGAWKTYLAACQFNWLTERAEDLSRVLFFTDIELSRLLREHEVGRGPAPVTTADILDGAVSHLVVDDLGKRRVTDFVREGYAELLDAVFRSGDRVGVTITSNATVEGLAYDGTGQEVYDPSMARRIQDTCVILEIRSSASGG